MVLTKAVAYTVIVLVLYYSLENQGYTQSLNVLFERLLGIEASHLHAREKREISNSSVFVVEAVVRSSDLASLQALLSSLSFPLVINTTTQIISIDTTTVCTSNVTGYQCRCERSFAWSFNSCISQGACDAIAGNTCGCINGLPADGQYCQLNISQPETPSPTPPNNPVEIDLVIDLRLPFSSFPQSSIDIFRQTLKNFTFPHTITQSLTVTAINLTTVCYPNTTVGLQCHCEEQFYWPCDKCNNYSVCSNAIGPTCDCINGLPSDGGFCEPIINASLCPTPTPVFTEEPTSPSPTPTSTPTPPKDPVEIDFVLDLRIPFSSVLPNFIDIFRQTLKNFTFPHTITQSLIVTGINFTTACTPHSIGRLQCHCERDFAWPCDRCNNYSGCNNSSRPICDCINELPSDGGFCEPITNISPCPTPTPVITEQPTSPSPTPTSTPTPPKDPVETDLVLNLRIPVSSAPLNFISIFRQTLETVLFPQTISQSLMVTSVNFTTACSPDSIGGLQCHCEKDFAWPCDKCNNYSVCSNATGPTCDCINGLPSDGGFCEPITNIMLCPPTEMPNTTVTPSTATPTTMTPSTATPTTMTTPATPTPETPTPETPTPETPTPETPSTPETPAPPPEPSTPTEKMTLSLVMDRKFQPSDNDPSSIIYQDTNNTIQTQCRKHISTLKSVTLDRFRSGSTIADYTVTATSLPDTEIEAVKVGVFTQLAEKYPMIFDNTTPLEFKPDEVFSGDGVKVKCGPPSANLNFGTSWREEWYRNDRPILEDSQGLHNFSRENGAAILEVSKSYSTDNGRYECRLKTGSLTYRQKSMQGKDFMVKSTPVIQVTPANITVGCLTTQSVLLKCSVDSPYMVEFKDQPDAGSGSEIDYTFPISNCETPQRNFTCQEKTYTRFKEETTLMLSADSNFVCRNTSFGDGRPGDEAKGPCEPNKVGEKTAVCRANGQWEVQQDNCILKPVQELLEQSQNLNHNSLPDFLDQLRNVTVTFTDEVVGSPATIGAIVRILENVANASSSLSILITERSMTDVLETAGVLTTDEARTSWVFINANDISNIIETRTNRSSADSISSTLLQSLETITSSLINGSFNINTPSILLNKTTFTDTFSATLNSSVEIEIPESNERQQSITVITFASMDNVLPARDELNSTGNVINGRVVLVQSNATVNNVSFTFDLINETFRNPQCVFWNFSLFDGLGGWDDEGCELVRNVNETVTCNCNHLTSFSILMSPFGIDDPVLDFITYIGVGISMASLVICLIIEAVIWRKIRKNTTSYLRHVSIVNIAVSLLIANIWFIIGADISDPNQENQSACNAATFFIHLFYLALFFWMLASALLLFYRTVSVFDGGLSKKSMLAIGFSLGYGAPLIIAIITIAVTAPKNQYIRETGVCWLNWDESKALLAFVIPALLIVVINFIILLVVIYKMLRRRAVGDAAQAAERHVLVVIVRSLAVLTPFFGLTWSLGVGTMTDPHNRGIHIAFAFFNSLQGFFILVFGTLLDKKVRSELAMKSQSSTGGTRSTSGGNSSSSGLGFLRNWRRGRDGYHVSSGNSGASQSFSNT